MDEAPSRPNQRQHKRYQLTALVDIIERSSRDFVGRLVNINTKGLMIIGDYPFTEDTLYQLELVLPKNLSPRPSIALDVDCLWTRPAQDDANTSWSGFSIYSCSGEAKSDIQHLLDQTGV